jgi:hypothetical protein
MRTEKELRTSLAEHVKAEAALHCLEKYFDCMLFNTSLSEMREQIERWLRNTKAALFDVTEGKA